MPKNLGIISDPKDIITKEYGDQNYSPSTEISTDQIDSIMNSEDVDTSKKSKLGLTGLSHFWKSILTKLNGKVNDTGDTITGKLTMTGAEVDSDYSSDDTDLKFGAKVSKFIGLGSKNSIEAAGFVLARKLQNSTMLSNLVKVQISPTGGFKLALRSNNNSTDEAHLVFDAKKLGYYGSGTPGTPYDINDWSKSWEVVHEGNLDALKVSSLGTSEKTLVSAINELNTDKIEESDLSEFSNAEIQALWNKYIED